MAYINKKTNKVIQLTETKIKSSNILKQHKATIKKQKLLKKIIFTFRIVGLIKKFTFRIVGLIKKFGLA